MQLIQVTVDLERVNTIFYLLFEMLLNHRMNPIVQQGMEVYTCSTSTCGNKFKAVLGYILSSNQLRLQNKILF